MTTRREPFLPLFVGDFLASTGEWSGEQQGLYLVLLAHQWAVGSLPTEIDKLIRLTRWERRAFVKAWEVVGEKFTVTDGRYFNQRLEEHRQHAVEIAGRRAIAGAKGGSKRAANAKQMPSNCQPNASNLLKHQSINDSEDLRSSGAEPPPGAQSGSPTDPKKALWDIGVSVLGEPNRSLIGQACKRVGEPRVAEVLAQMAADPKADPKSWFIAATSERKRGFVC